MEKASSTISLTAKMCKIHLNDLAMLAFCLLILLGQTEHHSAWAQSRNDENNITSRTGSPREGSPEDTVRQNENEYTVTLNDITWGNRFKWAAQAIVAPERLNELVSIYIYEPNNLCESSTVCQFFSELDIPESTDLYVGVAVNEGGDRGIWRALPLSRQDFDRLMGSLSSGDGDLPYIVSSIPSARVPAERNLWVSERDWQDGLSIERRHRPRELPDEERSRSVDR